MMDRTKAPLGVLAALTAAGLALACPAAAQDATEGVVNVTFDAGAYDGDRQDWPIAVVEVGGDLDVGELFAVELLADGDVVLWSGTDTFAAPATGIDVDPFVAVGDLTAVRVLQQNTVVAEVLVEPAVDAEPPGEAAPEIPAVVAAVEEFEEEPPPPPPREGVRAEIFRQGGGSGGGGGPLALSMILAVVVVAIVFRSPLPSASTQRWTK